MKKENDVAAIIVDYKGLPLTIECLKSLVKCSDKPDVILVDNNDQKEYQIHEGDLRDIALNITLISTGQNLGFAEGNNVGIKKAISLDYEYILLLNNDTVVEPHFLSELKKRTQGMCISCPEILYYSSPETVWFAGGEINKRTGNAVHYGYGENSKDYNVEKYVSFATGCCFLMSCDVIKTIGFLERDFFMYCEDAEYCIRLQEHGGTIKYVPSALIWHKVSSASGGEASPLSIYYSTRNRFYMIQKHRCFFSKTAMVFTFFSRVIRLIQFKLTKKTDLYLAMRTGLFDFLLGKTGIKQ